MSASAVTVYCDFRGKQKPVIKPAGDAVKPGAVEFTMIPLSDVSFVDRFELILWPSGNGVVRPPYATTLKPCAEGFKAAAWLPAGSFGVDVEAFQIDELFGKKTVYGACCHGSLEVK